MRVSHKHNLNEKVQYIDRVREVQSVEYVQPEVDLDSVKNWCSDRIDEQNVAHAMKLQEVKEYNNHVFGLIKTEFEMQRRALIALKMQRDIDRNRRLMFIQRVKKQRDAIRNENFKLKLAVGASFLLTLVAFIIK